MKPVTWSHSSLKDYEGCPRRYHEVKVLKNYPFTDTQATIYGKELHEAAELYIRDGDPLPAQFSFIQEALDALLKKPGRKLCEHKMGVRADLSPCGFADKDVWCRGIADLLIIDDDNLTARVVDYKTGNNKYPDREQLKLMALMVFAHFPHIRRVSGALLFVVKNDIAKASFLVGEAEEYWWDYRERVARIEQAHESGVWNPRPTPLCGWCPVMTCEHNRKRD
ncbi:PD-(D/E)XK nuclease family protein [bacterium]|nr:PD-(D/E)XK nuclease family protein [bacterium]